MKFIQACLSKANILLISQPKTHPNILIAQTANRLLEILYLEIGGCPKASVKDRINKFHCRVIGVFTNGKDKIRGGCPTSAAKEKQAKSDSTTLET